MPKEIVSAADVLDQTDAGAEPVATPSPVVEPVVTPTEPTPPEAGFETPPDVAEPTPAEPETVEPAAPIAAPSAADVLAEAAAPAPAVEPPKKEEPPAPALGSIRSDMASLASEASALGGDQGKKVEAPAEPVAPTPGQKAWRFVKNIHPGEVITFKDKSTYKFPLALHVIFDEDLAKKILEVADIFHIVQQ